MLAEAPAAIEAAQAALLSAHSRQTHLQKNWFCSTYSQVHYSRGSGGGAVYLFDFFARSGMAGFCPGL